MTDPIADMLARIRNATQSRHPRVDMPLSRLKVEIATILEAEGYIQGFKVKVPKGVKIDVRPGAVEVQGPKGKLLQPLPPGIGFELDGDTLTAKPLREDAALGKFHGLARSLVANAVKGVTEGFRKDLDIVGVG